MHCHFSQIAILQRSVSVRWMLERKLNTLLCGGDTDMASEKKIKNLFKMTDASIVEFFLNRNH